MTSEKSSENQSPKPVFVIMRHATRDFQDDLLSPDGMRQAATLARVLRGLGLALPTRIQTSPKNRTRQTVRQLEGESHRHNVVDPRLDERHSGETQGEFEVRVAAYCDSVSEWAEDPGRKPDDHVWLACSHLDWLEAAVWRIPSDENDFERSEPWPPMAIRAYVYEDGIWRRLLKPSTP